MQAPKKRVSVSRRNMRRAHDFISVNNPARCSNCGAAVRSHTVCNECGFYRGRQILGKKSKSGSSAEA